VNLGSVAVMDDNGTRDGSLNCALAVATVIIAWAVHPHRGVVDAMLHELSEATVLRRDAANGHM